MQNVPVNFRLFIITTARLYCTCPVKISSCVTLKHCDRLTKVVSSSLQYLHFMISCIRFTAHCFGKSVQPFATQSRLLTIFEKKALKNTSGKGENAFNQHFLLFPRRFLLCERGIHHFGNVLFVVCTCFQFGNV